MPADLSPTARALMALEIVQGHPGITAERLGTALGVTERAARRYVSVLREAGIPIDAARGPYGGYRVGRGLRLPPVVFTDTEALGLVMAALDGHHHAGDPRDPVGSALGKLIRALPASVAAQAEAVRLTAAAVPDRFAARPDPGTTTALVQACSAHRRARIDYRSEAGTQSHVEVEPWAVVVRHGRWYLMCLSLPANARRAYRVDRVVSVTVLPDEFVPPAGLDPVALLEEHLAEGWEYDVEVLVDAPLADLERRVPRSIGRLEAVDATTTRLVGSTSNPWFYAEQLATLPASYRIVRGPEVRDAARVVGERLLAAATAPPEPGNDRAR